jgi:hypothetical protein
MVFQVKQVLHVVKSDRKNRVFLLAGKDQEGGKEQSEQGTFLHVADFVFKVVKIQLFG